MDTLLPIVIENATTHLGQSALATARILGIFVLAPFFGAGVVPWRIRIVLALLLGGLAGTGSTGAASYGGLPALVVSEFLVGGLLGFGLALFANGLRFAGELIDGQMGVTEAVDADAFGTVADGPLGPSTRLLSGLAVVTVFFAITPSGRMPVLESLLLSFDRLPPGQGMGFLSMTQTMTSALSASAELAIRGALPVISVLALVGWANGLLARGASQFQVASLGLAVRPLLGLAVLVATFGGISELMTASLSGWLDSFAAVAG